MNVSQELSELAEQFYALIQGLRNETTPTVALAKSIREGLHHIHEQLVAIKPVGLDQQGRAFQQFLQQREMLLVEVSRAVTETKYSECYTKTLAFLANAKTREEYISILKDSHMIYYEDMAAPFGVKLFEHNSEQDAFRWSARLNGFYTSPPPPPSKNI